MSIWNSQPVKGLTLALYEGGYDFYSDNQRISGFDEGKIFYITLYNNSLLLSNTTGSIGIFDDLFITSRNDSSRIQIASIDPKLSARVYSDNIHLKIEYGRILILNELDIEKYIAGVVEAEAGVNALPEFYKAQSLLCRTYLYDHLNRHETEGFNLCDEVHCQAYKGTSPFTRFVYQSTVQTRNKVITDSNNELVTASFHANCGGQTESSLNTWLKKEDYLVPVVDDYCLKSANATWEKKVSLAEWKKYLISHGIKA
ncbi:MAG TPA: SpoIID/LytB domain-containing protein, partial [Bacteroidales bacterium]|nr:SpoIID/LytB domain-containing protein [Bacteroidales bacterium]